MNLSTAIDLVFSRFGFRGLPCIRPKCRTNATMYSLHANAGSRLVYACTNHLDYAVSCVVADAEHEAPKLGEPA